MSCPSRKMAAKHAEIARHHDQERKRKRPGLTVLRLRELNRLFRARYGELFPDDDAGREDVILLAHHLAHLNGDAVKRIVSVTELRAPWMTTAEARIMAERISAKPLVWSADTLAWRLGLTLADRTRLKIRTIGAIDSSVKKRRAERRNRDRAYQAERRQAAGAKPRSRSDERLKPWIELGVSRRTWYRRKTHAPTEVALFRRQYVESSISSTNPCQPVLESNGGHLGRDPRTPREPLRAPALARVAGAESKSARAAGCGP
jgi:hypothetical protein